MRISGVVRSLFDVIRRWRYLPLIALIAAVWPVWSWLAARMLSDTAEAWALLSLATAVVLLSNERASALSVRVTRDGLRCGLARNDSPRDGRPRWGLPILLMAAYAASYLFVPPLVRSIIAMSAIAAACSELYLRRRMDLRLWGLLLLSLPLIPTLNFYLGYPLRVVVGDLTSILLHMNGFSATREGTILLWGEKRISIDAPCSGIKMLWTGMYLSCALATLHRFDTKRTILLGALALIVVVLANVLRAAALFYVEAGIFPEAQSAHAPIGVIVFICAAAALALIASKLRAPSHAH